MTEVPREKASILQVAKAVFWSFLGIRRRAGHEADAVRISPLQVVIAGLVGGLLFIFTLVIIVRMVIAGAGA